MNNFLTFRFSNKGWTPSNKYCQRDYAFFSQSNTNFVLYPALKGNCTCGLTIQIAEQYDHPIRNNGESGLMGNANTYFDKSGLKNTWLNEWKSVNQIQVGCAICYDGWYTNGNNCGGHVQFVYDIDYANDKVLIGESLYKTLAYQTRWIKIPKQNEEVFLFNGYRFVCQGFLIPPYSIDKRVSRDSSKEQVEIIADELRVRKSPNGEVYEGQYFLTGIYNVQEIKEDGIKWAKLGDEIWVGLDERYVKHYPKQTEEIDYKKLYLEAQEKLDKIKKVLE